MGLATQVEALKEMNDSGKASDLRERVLEAVEASPLISNKEIAQAIGIEAHVCSARVSELERAGKIKKDGTKVCNVSGRVVTAYTVGAGDIISGTKINMVMGVSFNQKSGQWVVYFDGKIIANVKQFVKANELLKAAYLNNKGL